MISTTEEMRLPGINGDEVTIEDNNSLMGLEHNQMGIDFQNEYVQTRTNTFKFDRLSFKEYEEDQTPTAKVSLTELKVAKKKHQVDLAQLELDSP